MSSPTSGQLVSHARTRHGEMCIDSMAMTDADARTVYTPKLASPLHGPNAMTGSESVGWRLSRRLAAHHAALVSVDSSGVLLGRWRSERTSRCLTVHGRSSCGVWASMTRPRLPV